MPCSWCLEGINSWASRGPVGAVPRRHRPTAKMARAVVCRPPVAPLPPVAASPPRAEPPTSRGTAVSAPHAHARGHRPSHPLHVEVARVARRARKECGKRLVHVRYAYAAAFLCAAAVNCGDDGRLAAGARARYVRRCCGKQGFPAAPRASSASPPPRLREDRLAHPVCTSRSNLASALAQTLTLSYRSCRCTACRCHIHTEPIHPHPAQSLAPAQGPLHRDCCDRNTTTGDQGRPQREGLSGHHWQWTGACDLGSILGRVVFSPLSPHPGRLSLAPPHTRTHSTARRLCTSDIPSSATTACE